MDTEQPPDFALTCAPEDLKLIIAKARGWTNIEYRDDYGWIGTSPTGQRHYDLPDAGASWSDAGPLWDEIAAANLYPQLGFLRYEKINYAVVRLEIFKGKTATEAIARAWLFSYLSGWLEKENIDATSQ